MDISSVKGGLEPDFTNFAGRILMPATKGLASKYSLGQTIKARVLLQNEQRGSYTVLLGNDKHVVHSDLMLKANETIDVKIVELRDNFIHLRRVNIQNGETEGKKQSEVDLSKLASRQLLAKLADHYSSQTTGADLSILRNIGKSFKSIELVTLIKSLLYLRKMGVVPDRQSLEQFISSMKVSEPIHLDTATENQVAIETLASQTGVQTSATQDSKEGARQLPAELVRHIQKELRVSSETTNPEWIDSAYVNSYNFDLNGGGTGTQRDPNRYGETLDNKGFSLLKGKMHAKQSHSQQSLAFVFDNQLIEVDLAVFGKRKNKIEEKIDVDAGTGQEKSGKQKNKTDLKTLVFALKTNELGEVSVKANIIDRRICINFFLENEQVANGFEMFSDSLAHMFSDYGWSLDHSGYETLQNTSGFSAAKAAIMEKGLLEDSLSRLL